MPLFKVVAVSVTRTEREVIVEAPNMGEATVKGLNSIRHSQEIMPRTSELYFDEARTTKLDTMIPPWETNVVH